MVCWTRKEGDVRKEGNATDREEGSAGFDGSSPLPPDGAVTVAGPACAPTPADAVALPPAALPPTPATAPTKRRLVPQKSYLPVYVAPAAHGRKYQTTMESLEQWKANVKAVLKEERAEAHTVPAALRFSWHLRTLL